MSRTEFEQLRIVFEMIEDCSHCVRESLELSGILVTCPLSGNAAVDSCEPMPTEIVRHLSPEEQELARKRHELAILQAELTDRELSLANLRAELAAFEGRYLREVGVLYAELDDWNAKIAEFAAEAAGTEQARTAASEARAQAEDPTPPLMARLPRQKTFTVA